MIITWKGVLKTVQHNTVLFVMESRVSSNCTCNIHRLSSEKEVNWKENIVEIHSGDSKVYAWTDTDLGEVLFYYVMFGNKENRDLLSKIYRISFGGTFYDFQDH